MVVLLLFPQLLILFLQLFGTILAFQNITLQSYRGPV